nr:hypothetical protein [Streptomyces dysideae]
MITVSQSRSAMNAFIVVEVGAQPVPHHDQRCFEQLEGAVEKAV